MSEQEKKIKFIGFILGIAILIAAGGAIYFWQKFLPENKKQTIEQSIDSFKKQIFYIEPEKDKEIVLTPKTKLLFKKGYDVYIFDTATSSPPKHILSSDILKDFSLSPDGKFMAYTLKETGIFSENSDAYLVDLQKNQVKRLDPKNNIATLNPMIFPDNSKVAFIKREYSTSTKSLPDGEVWMIDADINSTSSRKLFEAKKIEGLAEEQYCASAAEKKSVKIGLTNISPDGKTISYWSKDWASECSGLWNVPYFSSIDGADFFTEKFMLQNIFSYTDDTNKYNWQVGKISWLNNGEFLASNWAMPPIPGSSLYLYNKEQKKIWTIFDSFDANVKPSEIQFNFLDAIKKDNRNLIIVFRTSKQVEGWKYYIEELKLGGKIDLDSFNAKTPFFQEMSVEETLSDIKLLHEKAIVYSKKIDDKTFGLFPYNIQNKTEQKIDQAKTKIEFTF